MKRRRRLGPRRAALLRAWAAWVLCAGASLAAALGSPSSLSDADRARIRAVSKAYCDAWLANDEAAVIRLFTPEAVLLPHHGLEPVVGEAAIRAFWFPKGGPATTVTRLSQTVDEIGGSGDFAFLRGHSSVTWVTGTGATAKTSSNAGTFLNILRRQSDGSWRISHQMWDDPPNQRR